MFVGLYMYNIFITHPLINVGEPYQQETHQGMILQGELLPESPGPTKDKALTTAPPNLSVLRLAGEANRVDRVDRVDRAAIFVSKSFGQLLW